MFGLRLKGLKQRLVWCLLKNVNAATASLRLRRTVGTTEGTKREDVNTDTLAPSTAEAAVTTAQELRLDVVGDGVIYILPTADNKGSVGTDTRRWAMVRAVLVVSGDFVFENGWRLTEWGDGIALLRPDGSVAASWT